MAAVEWSTKIRATLGLNVLWDQIDSTHRSLLLHSKTIFCKTKVTNPNVWSCVWPAFISLIVVWVQFNFLKTVFRKITVYFLNVVCFIYGNTFLVNHTSKLMCLFYILIVHFNKNQNVIYWLVLLLIQKLCMYIQS